MRVQDLNGSSWIDEFEKMNDQLSALSSLISLLAHDVALGEYHREGSSARDVARSDLSMLQSVISLIERGCADANVFDGDVEDEMWRRYWAGDRSSVLLIYFAWSGLQAVRSEHDVQPDWFLELCGAILECAVHSCNDEYLDQVHSIWSLVWRCHLDRRQNYNDRMFYGDDGIFRLGQIALSLRLVGIASGEASRFFAHANRVLFKSENTIQLHRSVGGKQTSVWASLLISQTKFMDDSQFTQLKDRVR